MENVDVVIFTGYNGNGLVTERVQCGVNEVDEVEFVSKLVKGIFDNMYEVSATTKSNKKEIEEERELADEKRDSYIINIIYNHGDIFKKYFPWVANYIKFEEALETSLAKINVIDGFEGFKPIKSQRYVLSNLGTVRRASVLFDELILMNKCALNPKMYEKQLLKIEEFKDIIDMYYPNIEELISIKNEQSITRK